VSIGRKPGAGEGNRTLVCSLGSCRSAIELRPPSYPIKPGTSCTFSPDNFSILVAYLVACFREPSPHRFYSSLQRRAASRAGQLISRICVDLGAGACAIPGPVRLPCDLKMTGQPVKLPCRWRLPGASCAQCLCMSGTSTDWSPPGRWSANIGCQSLWHRRAARKAKSYVAPSRNEDRVSGRRSASARARQSRYPSPTECDERLSCAIVSRRARRTVAIHEAGHAVAAIVHDIAFKHVTICPPIAITAAGRAMATLS
jgi:hypothetical protein